ncbi:MAG: hypothetical protein GF313_14075 [Caldithrix sp.]|nr:hypothetical protein [Caldithrix sp.]
MKSKILLLFVAFIWMGCAAYKHLEPEPPISSVEDGFIQIYKDDDKPFELKKDKKYYMQFPAPATDNMYLVLEIPNKQLIQSALYKSFDEKEGGLIPVTNENEPEELMSVYGVDNSVPVFYWIVDSVITDLKMQMEYRYVPQWRYQFENKHAQFEQILQDNKADHDMYENIGGSFTFDGFDFTAAINDLDSKTAQLKAMQTEFEALQQLFPVDIKNTSDKAYQDYVDLNDQLENELQFQQDFRMVLTVFQQAIEGRQNRATFAGGIDDYNALLEQEARFPSNIRNEAKSVIAPQLDDLTDYFDNQLRNKQDTQSIELNVDGASRLHDNVGRSVSREFRGLSGFVKDYNKTLNQYNSSAQDVQQVEQRVNQSQKMPSDFYFSDMLTQLSKINYRLPNSAKAAFGDYSDYRCARLLFDKISSLRRKINNLQQGYRQADKLVPQINALKGRKDYSGMLRILKNNRHLDFLVDMYGDMDKQSLNTQKQGIQSALANSNWRLAEDRLRSLHQDDNFLNPQAILPEKNRIVKDLENQLWQQIEQTSVKRAKKFAEENISTVQNVPALYENAAFMPVHEPTYTTGGQSTLRQRTQKLYDQLNYIKEVEFPTTAIKGLYSTFTRNPDDQGVLTARAIVAHGEQYRGNDQTIRNRIAECDPMTPKWITKARDYRRVFALPITDNAGGDNTYLLKLNLQIPSDAKFPVFDVNVKLPKSVAGKAASEQWYEKIAINDDIIKNEGRFTITSPTAQNGYECQITPVRLVKNENNVLEIRFSHDAFEVLEISVMAQKPIIKKH